MYRYRSALNTLFYLVCFGIVYGSLFPFQFSLTPEREVIDNFLVSWKTFSGPGDILGNVVLFLPFGLLARFLAMLPGKHHGNTRFFVLVWLLVAVGSQLVQFFVPGRDPAIFDLYSNAGGAVLGWVLGRFIPEKTNLGLAHVNLLRQVALLLPLLWLASELIPFVPSIDFQSYKNAIKPLFLYPRWEWYEGLMQASSWVVCFYLLHKCAGFSLRFWHLLAGMIAVLLLKIVIVQNNVSVTDVVAIAVALAVWVPLAERPLRPQKIAYLLLFSLAVTSVFPFVPRAVPASFGWIPFSGFLEGSMLANATALCQKLFVFGSIVFLTDSPGGGWKKRSWSIALVLALLEFVQVWVASGTPELTDPMLFLGIAWLYSAVLSHGDIQSAHPGTGRGEPREQAAGIQSPGFANRAVNTDVTVENAAQLLGGALSDNSALISPSVAQATVAGSSRRRLMMVIGAYCATVIILLKILLGLPGIPYNVVELFRFGATGVDLLFFSLTMLSVGWGGAWLGTVFATTTRPLRDIPLALVKLAFIIYFLLWMSVTRESIMDIAGSSVFVHRVMERGVLGDFGVQLIGLLGRSNVYSVTSIFEPVLRLGALVWPFLIFYGLCFCVAGSLAGSPDRGASSWKRTISSGILILLWLYMSKVLAFDWSSTDNLNELIAPDGPWGIGGGGYLYLLLLLFSGLGALLSRAHFRNARSLLIALVIVMASLPASWLLLNHGLGQDIGKYGSHFSGVDFLLGPDRDNLISESQLMLRWSVLHTVIVIGLAFSASLYTYWTSSKGVFRSAPKATRASSEFRVYEEQWEFLQNLARSTGLAVDKLVLFIIAYFGAQIAASVENSDIVRSYINQNRGNSPVSFSPEIIHMELPAEAIEVLSALDPDKAHSDSRVFRKLLKIFMTVAEENSEGS